jgi:putative Mg2+ transporter-C (MgtC) family protein
MPTSLAWPQIALRLLLTALAAGFIGLNRDEHGRPAGLRTNILVGLAACIAMIQANLLINSNGKSADSFVVMDIMRLPLGILSGIGFIGAGAILKKGNTIVGVTTAATLWFVTVMGLCFGGGQLILGIVSFALGLIVLALLRHAEDVIPRQCRGILRVRVDGGGPGAAEIEAMLREAGLKISRQSIRYDRPEGGQNTFGWRIAWKCTKKAKDPPPALQQLTKHPQIQRMELLS